MGADARCSARRGLTLGERAFPRHTRPAREPGWRRAVLRRTKTRRRRSSVAGDRAAARASVSRIGGAARPRGHGATVAHERQAPLDRDRRLGERLRERDAERLEGLLLGAAPDDTEVRELGRPALEELALAPLGLEQRDLAVGKLAASGMPGVPPPEPTSTIGASASRDQRRRRRSASSSEDRRASPGSRSR